MTSKFKKVSQTQQDAALDSRPSPQTWARSSSRQRRVLNGFALITSAVARFVADCVNRLRAERGEIQNLMALDALTLRDIGLDRPRAIALPITR